jgi:hypothetical protein
LVVVAAALSTLVAALALVRVDLVVGLVGKHPALGLALAGKVMQAVPEQAMAHIAAVAVVAPEQVAQAVQAVRKVV